MLFFQSLDSGRGRRKVSYGSDGCGVTVIEVEREGEEKESLYGVNNRIRTDLCSSHFAT